MTLFSDRTIGVVQTLQHFANPNPIQINLGAASLTARLPHWLRMEEDRKIISIPERVTIVRRIVTSFLGGKGQQRIAETLNREKVPMFGKGAMWHRSYVSKVLTSPALIGTLVPREVVYEAGRRTRKALDAKSLAITTP
jgi:hypothetical protein